MDVHPAPSPATPLTQADHTVVEQQLGRPPRGLRRVAHRCPCGLPDVIETAPRLGDGTPFPTLYYLTCPRAASAIGTLESEGVMREMNERLASDKELAVAYGRAHEDYLRRRDAVEVLKGFPSAGGMPDRVKCLHVLVAHSLAAGPGVNPLGDEAIAMLPEWWRKGRCVLSGSELDQSVESTAKGPGACASPRPRVGDRGVPRDERPRAVRSQSRRSPKADGHQESEHQADRRPTRVAAIDCGTNSIRLLVADMDAEGVLDQRHGELKELDRRMTIVRLGQGVDRTGRLSSQALERTFAACREFAEVIQDLGAERVRFVATSASRDAENRQDFVEGVVALLGVRPEVITGAMEAELSFAGATRELAGRADLARPFLVLDIGGGSTEFVLGDERVRAARSVDIGCVRLTERHLTRGGTVSDPPSPEEIAAIRADIEAALDEAERSVPLAEAGTLVGLAGSVTTVGAMALGLSAYDPAAIHHTRVPVDQVREITRWLLAATHAERSAVPVMHPGRVDVIGAGALVLLAVMERVGARDVVVSEHDILDGIAHYAASEAR